MNARQILTISCLLLQAQSQAAEWQKLPPLPAPNGGFVVGVDHGKVVIAGGTNWQGGIKNWLKAVHVFDPLMLTWKTDADLAVPLAYGISGLVDETLVFAGGYTGEKSCTDQLWITEEKRVVKPGFPVGHASTLAAGGVIGGRMILSGGSPDPASLSQASSATWALDSSGKLEKLVDHPGPGFITAASATARNQLFVFGGAAWDEKAQTVMNLDSAHTFQMASNQWKTLRPLPYAVRGITGVALNERTIYLAGGYKNDAEGFTDEAWFYNIDQDTYKPAPSLPYKAMVSLVVCDGYLYCLGGEDKKQSRTDDCYRVLISQMAVFP
jgi:N-acetylneuraminic acid mutarotase